MGAEENRPNAAEDDASTNEVADEYWLLSLSEAEYPLA
jgi:hypothetical protein